MPAVATVAVSAAAVAAPDTCASFGCGGYVDGRACQCNPECVNHRSCCSDYVGECVLSNCSVEGASCSSTRCCNGAGLQCFLHTSGDDAICERNCVDGDGNACAVLDKLELPTLFCFLAMSLEGTERALVESQLREGVGIFACDAFQVFSSRPVQLAEGVWTQPLAHFTSLSHAPGAFTATWLNVEVFTEAWDAVFSNPKSREQEWIVKADPDTVFFPHFLQLQLQSSRKKLGTLQGDTGLYIKNCPAEGNLQLYGSLEVLSIAALRSYSTRGDRCRFQTNSKMGEDQWLQQCMDKLDVTSVQEPEFLRDGYCAVPNRFNPDSCTPGHAAYHPRKTVQQWWQCHDGATGRESLVASREKLG